MLLASLVRTEALLVPAARAVAAAEAAVSAAPCIVRFVRYQFAASVPSAGEPDNRRQRQREKGRHAAGAIGAEFAEASADRSDSAHNRPRRRD